MNCLVHEVNPAVKIVLNEFLASLEDSGYLNFGYDDEDFGVAISENFKGEKVILGIETSEDLLGFLDSGFYDCGSDILLLNLVLKFSPDPQKTRVFINSRGRLVFSQTMSTRPATFKEIIDFHQEHKRRYEKASQDEAKYRTSY